MQYELNNHLINDKGVAGTMGLGRPVISAVLPVIGDYLLLEEELTYLIDQTCEVYPAFSKTIELIVVLHGESWLRAAPFSLLKKYAVKIVVADIEEEIPAALLNRGAVCGSGEFLAFGSLGIKLSEWFNCLGRMLERVVSDNNSGFLAGRQTLKSARSDPLDSWKGHPADGVPSGYPGGWLEMVDRVPIASSLVSRDHFIEIGGFSCSPLLQRGFWWEFTVRSSRTLSIVCHDEVTSPEGRWDWENYPFCREVRLSWDLIARRVVRREGAPVMISTYCDWIDVVGFSRDLPSATRKQTIRKLQHFAPGGEWQTITGFVKDSLANARTSTSRLRVVVLGGFNESAHNQLCFFNYFALLEGKGILTWRSILDTAAHPVDLIKADLVIFSRVKSEQGCRLMDCCRRQGIPTIYMLDDNWFSVGKDWPEYAEMFSPGSSTYDRFTYCISSANVVLTYNKILARDIRPHNDCVELLPTNIDLSLFSEQKRESTRRPRIGYVGSVRKEDSAFVGLTKLAARRRDFDVIVMSQTVPDAIRSMSPGRVKYSPYVFGYRRYAKVLCEMLPDILLAPLEATRTDASKCPNKYLEITAAGAVGIYSDVPPYADTIISGVNGLLVDNDPVQWENCIEFLLDRPTLRTEMLLAAQNDVQANFDTGSVLPVFLAFLERVTGRKLDGEVCNCG